MQNGISNNIIIMEPSRNLRTLGRNALVGNWKVAIIAVLIYTLIVETIPTILNSWFGISPAMFMPDYYGTGVNTDMYSTMYSSMPSYSPISLIYLILVSGPLQLGISLFFLAMFRKQIVEVSDIFLGFEKFFKAVGLLIYQTIFILLWMCLFIIPGIIAAIRYSQAFFILADDPEKGIRQCMNESKAMMQGNKLKYFCLSLSFIGWALLAAIPAGICSGIITALAIDGILATILSVVTYLFTVPVMVYMWSTLAGFYEIASGHLIKNTEPAPIPVQQNVNI